MSASQVRRSRSPRSELIGALGAGCDTPSASTASTHALGFGATSKEDHTTVFVLNLPPYASIYLGAEGQLGGEAGDRVAGFWRTVGIVPDADPDHLASLLALYAHLGAARDDTTNSTTRAMLERMRLALLWEHLWPWVPAYTRAVQSLDVDPLARWARLLRATLADELATAGQTTPGQPTAGLTSAAVDQRPPLALRHAPSPVEVTAGLGALLDGMVAPVRSGMILTRRSLAAASERIGVGYRLGERRFALKAMVEQDPPATLAWLADEAERWASLHTDNGPDDINRWWAARAALNAAGLRQAHHGDPAAG